MQQAIQKTPFLKLDRSMVIGYLKSTGSRDPDVLHTQKAEILSAAKFPKMAGVYLMVMGGLLTITILGAFIGIPLLGLGWWMRSRGVSNLAVVDAAYSEYVGQARTA
jgi:hypothetical protein